MAQLVTRVDDSVVDALDELVSAGICVSRSEAVRLALDRLIDRHRRDRIGAQIVEGYRRIPQTEDEGGWSEAASRAMIADEPW